MRSTILDATQPDPVEARAPDGNRVIVGAAPPHRKRHVPLPR
jgi:hypothetical protein